MSTKTAAMLFEVVTLDRADEEDISRWMKEHTGSYTMTMSVRMNKNGSTPMITYYHYSFDNEDNALLFKLRFG